MAGKATHRPPEENLLNTLSSLMTQSKGKFTIFKGTDNQWYFRLRAPNGETLCHSEGYTTRQSALNGVAAVKSYAIAADVEG
jgi:uncharacterized protein YegP (UPF0339 family)